MNIHIEDKIISENKRKGYQRNHQILVSWNQKVAGSITKKQIIKNLATLKKLFKVGILNFLFNLVANLQNQLRVIKIC